MLDRAPATAGSNLWGGEYEGKLQSSGKRWAFCPAYVRYCVCVLFAACSVMACQLARRCPMDFSKLLKLCHICGVQTLQNFIIKQSTSSLICCAASFKKYVALLDLSGKSEIIMLVADRSWGFTRLFEALNSERTPMQRQARQAPPKAQKGVQGRLSQSF